MGLKNHLFSVRHGYPVSINLRALKPHRKFKRKLENASRNTGCESMTLSHEGKREQRGNCITVCESESQYICVYPTSIYLAPAVCQGSGKALGVK